MNHGLAHLFGRGLAPIVPQRDLVRGAIVLHNQRMVHRNFRSALLEIAEWVTLRGHQLSEKPVGVPQGGLRIIDEPGLNRTPGVPETGRIFSPKWVNRETFDSFFKFLQFRFRAVAAAGFFDRPVVLGTKPGSQSMA